MAGPRKQIDWEKGEKLYRLGQLSAAEIGKQLGCPTSTVTRHMKTYGVRQDKKEEVLRRTQEAIATQRNATLPGPVAEITEEDIDNAVNANIALITSHRKSIARLAEIEGRLLEELSGEPTKLYLAQFKGEIVEKTVALTVTEKASALLSLSSVQAKRIDKQRQAFGIPDEVAKPSADGSLEDLSNEQLMAFLLREP